MEHVIAVFKDMFLSVLPILLSKHNSECQIEALVTDSQLNYSLVILSDIQVSGFQPLQWNFGPGRLNFSTVSWQVSRSLEQVFF